MNLQPRRVKDPEVSLVSLIDVVLMLLIFFMLSTSFIHPSRIQIMLPKASATQSVPPNAPIVVTVTRTGRFLVNGRALVNPSAATLRAALRKVAQGNQAKPILIRADARAATQKMVTVMDVAGRLGFTHIDILTNRRKHGATGR